MPYVGRGLTTGAQYQKLDDIAINNATTFTMQVSSVNVSPDQNHLILVVNGVIQEPGTGFTVAGSTCTLASAITTSGHSGTDTIYGVIAGDAAFAAYDSIGVNALGVTAGTVTASRAVVPDSNKDIASFRNVTLTGELDSATLDVSGNADIDATTNLDAVDIDGAVQIDATFTSGVDGQGYDTKFFGDTSSAYMLWDTSADDLVFAGAAGIDLAGDIDVDGTANLDAVDIDGAVQIDATFTSGVDGQGYDTKFFGDTSGAYIMWDTSADDLIFVGAAGLDIAGSIDVDGTANLDIVDIDGALTVDSTATNKITHNHGSTALEIENLGSKRGLYVHSDVDSGQDNPLVEIKADNTGFDQEVLRVHNDGTGHSLQVLDDGSEVFSIVSGGNVGIGVTDPDEELEVNGSIHASGGIYSGSISVADDAVGSITPPRQGVIMSVIVNAATVYPQVAQSGIVFCDTGSSLSISAIWNNSQFDQSTSDVTGTTGTDTNVTVAVQAGVIKIENRMGETVVFHYSFIG